MTAERKRPLFNKALADARAWSSPLNAAAWEFVEAHQDIVGEPVTPVLFNNVKAVLRRAILKFLNEVKKEA